MGRPSLVRFQGGGLSHVWACTLSSLVDQVGRGGSGERGGVVVGLRDMKGLKKKKS